jgi:hypothetical protein
MVNGRWESGGLCRVRGGNDSMRVEVTEARIDRGVIKQFTYNAPHKIECSNGETYVLKPRLDDKQFANELLALALGEAIGVPMITGALVSVDEAFRQASPLAATKYEVNIHFGSKFMPKSWTFDNPAPSLARSEIRNFDDLYAMVAFDEVVANCDRSGNEGNNMVVQISDTTPRYDYIAIDHGHILTGADWTAEDLRCFQAGPIVPVFPFLAACLTSLPAMQRAAQNVADLQDQYRTIAKGAHAELTNEDLDAVVLFLEGRATNLPTWVIGHNYRATLQALL